MTLLRVQLKLIVLLFCLIYLSYCLCHQIYLVIVRRKFKRANRCEDAKTKYPLKDPIFGLDLVMDTIRNAKRFRHLEGTAKRYQKYGPTFTSRLITFPTVFTIDPENIKTILSTKFEDYRLSTIRVKAMVPIFGQGIFTTDGHKWSQSRALLRPTFTKENIANLEAIESHFQYLLKCIPLDGSTVYLQELFFRLTMDTATEFLFGKSVHSQSRAMNSENKDNKFIDAEFVDYYTYTQLEASHNVRLGPLARLRYSPKANRARDKVFAYVDRYIDQLLKTPDILNPLDSEKEDSSKPYIFLEELAQRTSDRLIIRDQILNILLAGRDTTASLLSNLFFMLARSPRVFEKLRTEVMEILHGDLPTYDLLKKMTYLRYCINESLRLHPVVPANTREAVCDTVLPHGGGSDGLAPLFVKKGTQVLYSVYSMHRREDFYGSDVESFRPERWAEIKPRWEYLPFNGGPRICLGQQFALTEASYVTVRLLQEFVSLESRDSEPWMEAYTLVVCSQNGTKVALKRA